MVVVAANSGLPTPPSWYLNLKAEPAATVDVEGRTLRVRAEELPEDEAAAFWPRVLEAAPDYARYPRWASRRIPLLRLVPAPPALLDGYLPEYDVSECHACLVEADVETTWAAVGGADLSRIGPVRALLVARAVPGRLRARVRGEPAPPAPPFTLADMPRVGFAVLAERPAEMAFGSVTRPWEIGDEQPVAIGPEAFVAFDRPGYAKVAFAIRADPYGPRRTLVLTETRVATTDARSRQRFASYWRLAGPASALIRRLILRRVKAQAEQWTLHAAARGC